MTTITPTLSSNGKRPWRLLRLLSCLAWLLTATSLPAATVMIDDFDGPNGGAMIVLGTNTPSGSQHDTGISVWGSERKSTLTRTSTGTSISFATINTNGDPGVLTYAETAQQSTTLMLEYGTGTLDSTDYELTIDIAVLQPMGPLYKVDLTVEGFNTDPVDPFTAVADATAMQSCNVQTHGTFLGGNAYKLSFDLSSAAFQNVHSFFNGTSSLAFSLMLYGANDSDVIIETIFLETLLDGPDVVPEPSTYALGSAAMLGLLYFGYRRRRAHRQNERLHA